MRSRFSSFNYLDDYKYNIIEKIFNKFSIKLILPILIFNFFSQVNSSISSGLIISNNESIINNSLMISNFNLSNSKSNDFIKNIPILKSYGPLILDINNINYDSGIFIIPSLNYEYKPLFLAINCSESSFNYKDKIDWRDWFSPFFAYELNILDDFCSI